MTKSLVERSGYAAAVLSCLPANERGWRDQDASQPMRGTLGLIPSH